MTDGDQFLSDHDHYEAPPGNGAFCLLALGVRSEAMNRLRLIAICFLTTARLFSQGAPADRGELQQLERLWNEAHLRGDAEALNRLWADDLEVAVPKMPVMKKGELVKFVSSGRMKFQRYETSDLNFRIYGQSAIVTGRLLRKREINGREVDDDWRFTKAYQRTANGWRVVSFHASESPSQ